jgi:hypothetical protein
MPVFIKQHCGSIVCVPSPILSPQSDLGGIYFASYSTYPRCFAMLRCSYTTQAFIFIFIFLFRLLVLNKVSSRRLLSRAIAVLVCYQANKLRRSASWEHVPTVKEVCQGSDYYLITILLGNFKSLYLFNITLDRPFSVMVSMAISLVSKTPLNEPEHPLFNWFKNLYVKSPSPR